MLGVALADGILFPARKDPGALAAGAAHPVPSHPHRHQALVVQPDRPMNSRPSNAGALAGALLLAMLAVLSSGCRTSVPMPPADFSGGGWQVQQGQAVWKPSQSRPELAGELLFATR